MNTRLLARSVLWGMLVLTVVPGQCSPLRGPVDAPPYNATPEEVVEGFYRCYLSDPGSFLGDEALKRGWIVLE